MSTNEPLLIRQGREFSSTAFRRGENQTTVVPIPAGFEARMKFAPRFDSATSTFALTSSPAAGLTINYAAGEIAIYIGAVATALLNPNVQLLWDIEIYDPLNSNAIVYLGSGTAVVRPKVP